MANWLITVSFPELREHLGLAYGFYGLCAVLSGLFVWKWVMETKGVSLEDMHGEIVAANKPAKPTLSGPRRETAVTSPSAAWNNRLP